MSSGNTGTLRHMQFKLANYDHESFYSNDLENYTRTLLIYSYDF